MPDLFTKEQAPRYRRKHRKLMHVADAGSDMIHFKCKRCGHDNGWIDWDPDAEGMSVSQAIRGIPCPKCEGEDAYRGAL